MIPAEPSRPLQFVLLRLHESLTCGVPRVRSTAPLVQQREHVPSVAPASSSSRPPTPPRMGNILGECLFPAGYSISVGPLTWLPYGWDLVSLDVDDAQRDVVFPC